MRTERTHGKAILPAASSSLSVYAPGGMGKMFVEFLRRPSYLVELRMTEFQHAATRTLLALKAFETARGRLPGSLDELVPDYLEAVPLDPFDGKPLRWSAERKLIHSVGEDLTDSGGSAAGPDERALDDRQEPTLRIEATPASAPR